MTDKQKARAYDEALERAKLLHLQAVAGSNPIMVERYERIFPELAESEDKRIRKFLIDILSSGVWRTEWPFSPVDCVAYLEKQKENPQSANSVPSDCASNAKCEDRSPKHSDSDGIDIRDTPAYWRGWDDAMKQKEQKSVEWSEEDEEMIGNIISSLRGYMCLASKSPYYSNHETHIQKEIEFLNSLRPSWKPTEEHLSALLAIINDPNNIWSQTCQLALSDLYKQLERLKKFEDNADEDNTQRSDAHHRDR